MNSGGHAPLASPILRRPCWRLPGMIACSDKEESTHPVLLSRDGQVPALPIPAGAHCFYHYVVNKGVQMYSLHSSLWRYISQSWRCCALFFCRLKYARTQLTHTPTTTSLRRVNLLTTLLNVFLHTGPPVWTRSGQFLWSSDETTSLICLHNTIDNKKTLRETSSVWIGLHNT